MAYQNPKPILFDEEAEESVVVSSDINDNAPQISDYSPHDDIYFVFIDVLGFSQTFDEHRKDTEKEFAKKYKDTFQYYSHLINICGFNNRSLNCGAGQTSDSLYFYTDRIDCLVRFLYLYLHFSLYAMTQDVFFRGGIAKGCLFIGQPYQFYGDSVIKAYLLESNIAKLPRIAIDKQTYDELKADSQATNLVDGKNGRYYLKPFSKVDPMDLFRILDINYKDTHEIGENEILRIKEIIIENRNRFEFNESNYQKYLYLLDELEKVFLAQE